MEHGPAFPFRRKEAKENQIGGCVFLALPRGHGCIVKHGSSFLRCHRPECRGEGCLHPQPIPLARSVFCFFSSRKENVPLLFRRTRGRPAGEAQRRERANAGESCVVIGRNAAARDAFIRSQSPSPAVSFVSFLQEKKTYPVSLEEPAVDPQGKAGAYPGPSAVRLRARRAPRAAASCSLRGRAARQSRSRRQGSRSCLRAQCAQARASCRS